MREEGRDEKRRSDGGSFRSSDPIISSSASRFYLNPIIFLLLSSFVSKLSDAETWCDLSYVNLRFIKSWWRISVLTWQFTTQPLTPESSWGEKSKWKSSEILFFLFSHICLTTGKRSSWKQRALNRISREGETRSPGSESDSTSYPCLILLKSVPRTQCKFFCQHLWWSSILFILIRFDSYTFWSIWYNWFWTSDLRNRFSRRGESCVIKKRGKERKSQTSDTKRKWGWERET